MLSPSRIFLGSGVAPKCVTKENPKSDLDLGFVKNKSCLTTWVDPKTVIEPYPDPKNSLLGLQKYKRDPKIKSNQKS